MTKQQHNRSPTTQLQEKNSNADLCHCRHVYSIVLQCMLKTIARPQEQKTGWAESARRTVLGMASQPKVSPCVLDATNKKCSQRCCSFGQSKYTARSNNTENTDSISVSGTPFGLSAPQTPGVLGGSNPAYHANLLAHTRKKFRTKHDLFRG